MKIDLTTTLKNLNGSILVEGREGGVMKEVTIKDILSTILRVGDREEKEDRIKYDRYSLLKEINKEKKAIELTSEQIVDLKKLTNLIYTDVFIYGQTIDILEGKF